MKRCTYCNNNYPDNHLHCPKCGAPLIYDLEDKKKQKAKKIKIIFGVVFGTFLLILLCAAPFLSSRFKKFKEKAAENKKEQAYQTAFAALHSDTSSLKDYQDAIENAKALAYIPPILNTFLQKETENKEAYLKLADTLVQNGYQPQALRILSSGYSHFNDDSFLETIKKYFPMPCDVSSTFGYFNPIARMMGKTYDTLTWEDAMQVKYICLSQDYMGFSLSERAEFDSFQSFIPEIKYTAYSDEDLEVSDGFTWDRYTIGDHVFSLTENTYAQEEEFISEALGVFLNVSFLQIEENSFVPTSVISSLPNLTQLYAETYGDYAMLADGSYEDVYEPLRTLEHLKTLRGNLPMHNGLEQVTEVELSTNSEYTGAFQNAVDLKDGKPVWLPAQKKFSQKENLDFPGETRNGEQDFSLTGLYHYPSLETLRILHVNSACDLSVLADLPNLKTLEIRDCSSITNFSMIASLSSLETLILSDLPFEPNYQFIENMTGLKSLTLRITSLSPATPPDLSALTRLEHLEVNFDCQDSISSKNLHSLSLSCSRLGNLESMEELESLTVTGLMDFTGLGRLTKLSTLVLYLPVPKNTKELESLTSLKEIALYQLSAANAAQITADLPAVTGLYLRNITSDEGLSELCEKVSEKTSLEYFLFIPKEKSLNTATTYIIGEKIDIGELEKQKELEAQPLRYNLRPYISLFSALTNLKELCIQSSNLDDLSFLIPMEKLEALNLHDNVIYDPAPLSKASHLEYLDLRENDLSLDLLLQTLSGRSLSLKADWN